MDESTANSLVASKVVKMAPRTVVMLVDEKVGKLADLLGQKRGNWTVGS